MLTAVIKEDSREGGAECSDKGRQQGGGVLNAVIKEDSRG